MTWEDFTNNNQPMVNPFASNKEPTKIECPKCKRHIWRRTDIVLASNPPMYQYECCCGWVGYHGM